MGSLRLMMFGDFQVRDDADRNVTIAGSKPNLLLALLALRLGERQSRKRLMSMLWADRGESQARASLRQAIWSLRQALGGQDPSPLLIENETLALDPATVETDIRDFERAAAEGTPAALLEALRLYRAGLLGGIRVRESDVEDFVRNEQQRLQEIAIDACSRLLAIQTQDGQGEAAAATAKQMLAIDPLQEAAHRTLMEYYAAKKQIGLALQQYQTCRDSLRDALDVPPSTETQALFDRIRLGRTDTNAAEPAPDLHSTHSPDEGLVQQFDKPAIAVLPFANLSGEPEQEYFSDGITDDVITALSRLRWFLVISRNSSFAYKGLSVDVRIIGKELGVQYVLEGSVRKAGNRIRISVQLVDVISNTHIWAQNYDREIVDIFALQDDITQSVTAAIEPKLVAAEGVRSHRRSPEDLGAWDHVMRALTHYWRMTARESEMAIAMLRETVERYPDYAPAHSMLAFALLVSGHVGWIPESRDQDFAAELAERAIELDHEDPWAHLAMGYLAFAQRQTVESVREFRRALELNPNFSTAYGYLGWALAFDGQSDEAIGYFQQALRMSPYDPLKPFYYSGTGVAHYYARRYEEAIEWTRRALGERSGFAAAQRLLCASLAQAGRIAETQTAMARLRDMQPNLSIAWIEEHVPYTARAMPHFLDGMRKAGLQS